MTEPAESWRDHVEQMLRTWRCSHLNEDGDRLALDDFMDQDSIEDLIDFVCDEWSAPAPVALTDEIRRCLESIVDVWDDGQRPYDDRAYVGGTIAACIEEARSLLARTGETK